MRTTRKLLTIVAAVVLTSLLALPAAASADPIDNNAWIDAGEFIGYDDDDYDRHATVEVSGSLELKTPGSPTLWRVKCDVTGEIEIWNDWQSEGPTWAYNTSLWTGDTPARNAVTSLALDGDYWEACSTNHQPPGFCHPYAMSFQDLPWTGQATAFQPEFNDTTINLSWDGWGCTRDTPVLGSIRVTPVGESYCADRFVVTPELYGGTDLGLSGHLDIDDIEGLTYPCVLLY